MAAAAVQVVQKAGADLKELLNQVPVQAAVPVAEAVDTAVQAAAVLNPENQRINSNNHCS